MKLYYVPGACSMAAHIVLRESGLDFDLIKVDLDTRKTEKGDDFIRINPKGYVPALQLNDNKILTECAVIMQFVADQKPGSGLAPAAGTMDRYRLMETLHFISTELHQSFSPLFNPLVSGEEREGVRDIIATNLTYLNDQLSGKKFLMGDTFTIADAYLATVLGWTGHVQIDLAPWPNLGSYLAQIMSRPAVQKTLKAEGLAE